MSKRAERGKDAEVSETGNAIEEDGFHTITRRILLCYVRRRVVASETGRMRKAAVAEDRGEARGN